MNERIVLSYVGAIAEENRAYFDRGIVRVAPQTP
jgi:hypothetical protein